MKYPIYKYTNMYFGFNIIVSEIKCTVIVTIRHSLQQYTFYSTTTALDTSIIRTDDISWMFESKHNINVLLCIQITFLCSLYM